MELSPKESILFGAAVYFAAPEFSAIERLDDFREICRKELDKCIAVNRPQTAKVWQSALSAIESQWQKINNENNKKGAKQ